MVSGLVIKRFTHKSTRTFLTFIEVMLPIETIAVVVQGTYGKKGRSKAS